jgi:hypothetical protein
MKFVLFLLVSFLLSAPVFSATLVDRVAHYLFLSGEVYDSPGRVIIRGHPGAGKPSEIVFWGYPGPAPTEENLPSSGDTDAWLSARASQAEKANQAAKPANRKNAERKVIQFLRAEGAIATNAVSVTQEQIEALFAAWDLLPGNQGDTKASRYERLMRPVRLSGGSDLDVYFHPPTP